MRGRPPKEIVRNVAVKIRLTPEENALLANVCERTGQTKSEVIRNALNEYSRLVATKAIDINAQVNLTRTDMDSLGDIAEALRECGCLGACDFLRRVQSEVTKIVEYQEEQAAK